MINFRLYAPIFLSPFLLTGIYFLTGIPQNNIFFITNFLILLFSFCGMFFYPLRFYSLSKIVFIFIFIILGIVPLLNEIDNKILFGKEFNISDKILANLIIFIGILFFIMGNYIKINFFDRLFNSLPEIKKLNMFFFLLFFIVSFLILNKWNFDLNALLLRGTQGIAQSTFIYVDTNVTPQISFHFFTKYLRPMPFMFLFIFIYLYKRNKQFFNREQKLKNFILLWFLIVFSIFLNLPSSIDRSQTAILYIPMIIIFSKIWEKPFMMQTSTLGGILILFPFLDQFRRFNPEQFNFKIKLSHLQSAHFDAYQNFVRAIEMDFISYGNQLLGAFLFFVPRSFWPEKAIGSGSVVAVDQNYEHLGISMPFIGEGFVNFGIIGSSLFMFLLGVLLGNLDRIAWKVKNLNQDCLFLYYYYLLFGMVFFTMRGDLINSMAFLAGITASFWTLVILLKFFARLRFY
jgi:hypothetical protein